MERCTGSHKPAIDIRKSTQPKWFGQRFGVCAACGRGVRVRVNSNAATAHNPKPRER